ncbi:hypothetical protein [Burkholderia gladioli]|uniref:hypothetical protein n=1 Tax=Burkholderia gladioli TaxID=28095 RepID=UPI00164152A2|nr:hypothetical protein [Burkholderia gladioli]
MNALGEAGANDPAIRDDAVLTPLLDKLRDSIIRATAVRPCFHATDDASKGDSISVDVGISTESKAGGGISFYLVDLSASRDEKLNRAPHPHHPLHAGRRSQAGAGRGAQAPRRQGEGTRLTPPGHGEPRRPRARAAARFPLPFSPPGGAEQAAGERLPDGNLAALTASKKPVGWAEIEPVVSRRCDGRDARCGGLFLNLSRFSEDTCSA